MKTNWSDLGFFNAKVTDRYYKEAFDKEVSNLLLLDPDRLLAGFRETAGLIAGMDEEGLQVFMKKKERYGGMWEDGLIGGHTMGHYLVALSQAVSYAGISEANKEKVTERLNYIIDALYECQELTKGTGYEGYIFAATMPTAAFRNKPDLQFDNVEKGLSHLFNEAWVPWYTMHKIITGLNAAYRFAGNEKALEIDNKLATWIADRCESWSEEVHRTVLSIEYGGMNDCLYELYQINKDLRESGNDIAYENPERIKIAAHAFDEDALFERILAGGDNLLDNVHANTTIPKFIGALARYEVDLNEKRYLDYAKAFFDLVVDRHTYVTGGNSEDEHFGKDNILDSERTNVNNETCNTYNMLKFARRLFAVTGEKKYLDYSANTFVNAIVASFNHDTGFTTYFQPMATGFQKVFNTLEGNFWCCTGTGYENFTKLQRGIYFNAAGKLLVAMYLSSEVDCGDYNVTLSCDFAIDDIVKITVTPKEGKTVADDIYLRRPQWLIDEAKISIDGKALASSEEEGFFVIPKSMIRDGGNITLKLPMGVTAHNLQDGANTYAFCYGPYVLSARLGTARISETTHGVRVSVAASRTVDTDVLEISEEDNVKEFIDHINKHLLKRENLMEFDLAGVKTPLVFTTHYNQYTESYGIYWKLK